MKKVLTIAIVICITVTKLNAQSLDVGLYAGIGISNVNITNSPDISQTDFSSILSYNFNGYLSYKGKGFWGFSIEPGIIRKGWDMSFDNQNLESKIRLHYIQLPILSDFYLSDKIYFSLGPEICYLLSSKAKFKSDINSGTEDLKGYFSKFELSGLIAINYRINDNFNISFRYSHAVTEVADGISWEFDEYSENFIESNDYNQYFQLLFKIRLKNLRY